MKVKWEIHTGFAGATYSGTWNFDDEDGDITDEELDEMMRDELANHVDAYWERVE